MYLLYNDVFSFPKLCEFLESNLPSSKVNPGNPTGMILPKDLSGSHCASEDYDGVVGMSLHEA